MNDNRLYYEKPSAWEVLFAYEGVLCSSDDEQDGFYDGNEILRP